MWCSNFHRSKQIAGHPIACLCLCSLPINNVSGASNSRHLLGSCFLLRPWGTQTLCPFRYSNIWFKEYGTRILVWSSDRLPSHLLTTATVLFMLLRRVYKNNKKVFNFWIHDTKQGRNIYNKWISENGIGMNQANVREYEDNEDSRLLGSMFFTVLWQLYIGYLFRPPVCRSP